MLFRSPVGPAWAQTQCTKCGSPIHAIEKLSCAFGNRQVGLGGGSRFGGFSDTSDGANLSSNGGGNGRGGNGVICATILDIVIRLETLVNGTLGGFGGSNWDGRFGATSFVGPWATGSLYCRLHHVRRRHVSGAVRLQDISAC